MAEVSLKKSYTGQALHDLTEYFLITKRNAVRRNFLSCDSLIAKFLFLFQRISYIIEKN